MVAAYDATVAEPSALDVSTAEVLLAKAWTVVEFVDETARAETGRGIVIDALASSFETWLASVEGHLRR